MPPAVPTTEHACPAGPRSPNLRDPFAEEQPTLPRAAITAMVKTALAEDVGEGDLSAALIPAGKRARAHLLLREPAMVCGQAWFEACFHLLDPSIEIHWWVPEGEWVSEPCTIAEVTGYARPILTAERSALNFLQTLSGTATTTAQLVRQLQGSRTRLLDTRKTLPGLRMAQKYAVRMGGGHNHRLGLWDAVLIKENHIRACGSLHAAVMAARQAGQGRWIEVETESLAEVEEALAVGVDVIMLDELPADELPLAVQRIQGRAIAEISGGITEERLAAYAALGVDYLSSGSLTKHLRAIDFSLRFQEIPAEVLAEVPAEGSVDSPAEVNAESPAGRG